MKYIRGIYTKRLGRKLAGEEASKEDLVILKTLNIDVSKYVSDTKTTKPEDAQEADEPSEVSEEAAPKKRTRKKKASE